MFEAQQIIAQRFQLQQKLGDCSIRQTWLAKELATDSLVIIKLLIVGDRTQWQDIRLFEREAQILQQLKHPFIPQYHNYFTLESHSTWYVLVEQYIPGISLQLILDKGETFSEVEVKVIAKKLLDILKYLHRSNPQVLHRDIKPSNIILGEDKQIYLVDFGSIQSQMPAEGKSFTIVGTYGYTPLEQFGGRAVPASDLYALGVTLIHLLTGIPPAELPQKDLRIQFGDQVRISQHLADWLKKITEPALERRFSSVEGALDVLQYRADLTDNETISNHKKHQKLETEAQQWKYSGQKSTFLLSSKRLREVQALQRREPEKYPLSKLAETFVAKSLENQKIQSSRMPGYIFAGFLAMLGMHFVYAEEPANNPQSVIKNVIQPCKVKEECHQNIEALEKLVSARESLQFYNLSRANLEFADFSDANLAYINLSDANLRSANLYHADLKNSGLEDANLAYTNLYHADLESANLESARLFDVDLSFASLESADLESATLKFANLESADLESANLNNANFIRVKNLNFSQIKSACNWDKAVYKSNWDDNKRTWVVDERANRQYIKRLKQDRASDPKEPINCDEWK